MKPDSLTMIQGIETACPPMVLTQKEILNLVTKVIRPSKRAFDLYEKFLLDDGIETRHFAWDDPGLLLNESVDQKIKRFENWAVKLSLDASHRLLHQCQVAPRSIDALFVATCTGYVCPGLTTYIGEQLGLKESVYHLDLVGLGCAGALPAIRAANDYLNSHPDSNALVIAVEICSAAIHWAEKPELILSNSIFSDGAAAVLLTNRKSQGLMIKDISSILWPQFRDQLRFRYMDARLCNVISSKVPDIAASAIEALYEKPLDPLPQYAFHSGGRKVLDAIQQRLDFTDQDMGPSRDILKNYGNMSSPSVLFVLKKLLDESSSVVCFSFGAGFSASCLQLKRSLS